MCVGKMRTKEVNKSKENWFSFFGTIPSSKSDSLHTVIILWIPMLKYCQLKKDYSTLDTKRGNQFVLITGIFGIIAPSEANKKFKTRDCRLVCRA